MLFSDGINPFPLLLNRVSAFPYLNFATVMHLHPIRITPNFCYTQSPEGFIRIGTYSASAAASTAASSSVTWGASGLEIFWTGVLGAADSRFALLRRNFPNVPLKIFPRFVRLSPLPILNTSSLTYFLPACRPNILYCLNSLRTLYRHVRCTNSSNANILKNTTFNLHDPFQAALSQRQSPVNKK